MICRSVLFRYVFSQFEVKVRSCSALLADEMSWYSKSRGICQLIKISKLTFKTFNVSSETEGSVITVGEMVENFSWSGIFIHGLWLGKIFLFSQTGTQGGRLKFRLKRSGDLVTENKPITCVSVFKFNLKVVFLSVSKPVIIEMRELPKETLQRNTPGCFWVKQNLVCLQNTMQRNS